MNWDCVLVKSLIIIPSIPIKSVNLYFILIYFCGEADRRLNFILVLLISIVIISCNDRGASKFRVVNDIEFDTIRTAKRHHIEGDSKTRIAI